MSKCLCSSGKLYSDCCEKLCLRKNSAISPEELMRSRYVAFATGNVDYLWHSSSINLRSQLSKRDLKETCLSFDFVGLKVLQAKEDKVEFIASMMINQELHLLHELSTFIREDNEWKYDSGNIFPTEIVKLSRNDFCPCGSGKKYKKCHMK